MFRLISVKCCNQNYAETIQNESDDNDSGDDEVNETRPVMPSDSYYGTTERNNTIQNS